MKYCEEYPALLDLYIDGELLPAEAAHVQAHLDTCPSCRSYVDDALTIRAAFPDVEDTQIPDGFAESVCAAIQAQNITVPKRRKTPWMGVLASLAACCAIVILQQTGPITSGGGNAAAPSAAFDTAASTEDTICAAAKESVTLHSEFVETALSDTGSPNTESEAAGSMPSSSADQSTHSPTYSTTTSDALSTHTQPPSELASPSSGGTPEHWTAYENIVFSCEVFLSREFVGNALNCYEGKPYFNANFPEEGEIGIGYALEQAEFERILYEILDYPLGPMQNQNHSTDLCCIIITDNPRFL